MNEKIKFTVSEIGNGIWNINESDDNSHPFVDAYLIVGSKKALLVDTLIHECDLLKKIGTITSLPLEIIITHGHLDHAGFEVKKLIEQGYPIYMDTRDCKVLNSMSADKWEESMFRPVQDGMIFALGDRQLEIMSLLGHTPGSLVLLDRENQLLFSGDSIGSGIFWMQIPYTSTLVEFLANLKSLREKLSGLDRLRIHSGHKHQSPVPLTMEYIDDVYAVTEKIISGQLVGVPITGPTAERFPGFTTRGKLISDYCYTPERIR